MSSNKFEALGSDDSDNEELVNNHSNQQLEVSSVRAKFQMENNGEYNCRWSP